MIDHDHERLLAGWYGHLKPDRALDVAEENEDRAWYVDLDAWRGDDRNESPDRLRGPAAVDNILDAIRLASHQASPASTHLFAGFRGTGKTTELSRLTRELQALGAPGFSVLRVSARDYHPLSGSISVEEIAVLLAAGIGEAALRTLGENALPGLAKAGVWERVHERIRQTLGDQAVTFKLGIAELKPALRRGNSLRDQLRAALGPRSDGKLREFLHDFVLEIATAIHPRQLVVLVDDLDKYTVPTLDVADVYQSMADLFFHNGGLLKLPSCHTVYTIPPYLAFLNQETAGVFDGQLHVLPSVKVQGRPPDRVLHEPGVAALTELISQRVDLDRLFGSARDGCMARLVVASGGNLRDLGNLMAMVIQVALGRSLPVAEATVDEALNRQGAVRTLLEDDLEILLEISKFGHLGSLKKSRLGAFAGAMDQHLMLCCWNGDFWYDAHPLLASKLERARADAKLGATEG
ncbi:MAG: AAA family ATPase [Nannocystaceae bacterium]|nr:AAA family ATPase [Nannocystaceae bacterium]